MGARTGIEWTDATWNPVEGCSMAKGSEAGGCLNCYAARAALRRPAAGLALMRGGGPRWTGKVRLVEKRLGHPLHWRKARRVFVNSMSDLFHEALPDEAIDRVFAVMALCPQHTFQVLTKRPKRMLEWFSTAKAVWVNKEKAEFPGTRCDDVMSAVGEDQAPDTAIMAIADRWPLPNVWLGVSCEDQKTADERIPLLLQTPAAVRFVSYEPALSEVDFWWLDLDRACYDCTGFCQCGKRHVGAVHSLDWVIVGGESGPGARPFDIAWARNAIAQCEAARVACFVKQLGAHPYPGPLGSGRMADMALKDRKGGDGEEWPEDLRVREFPAMATCGGGK